MCNDFLKPNGKKIAATVITLVGVYFASLIAQGFTALLFSKELQVLKSSEFVKSMSNDLLQDLPVMFQMGVYIIIIKAVVTIIIVYICVCFTFWLINKDKINSLTGKPVGASKKGLK